VNNRSGQPDNHSILTNDAWCVVAKMLFPADELVRTSARDNWLINNSLLVGGNWYISPIFSQGCNHDYRSPAPKELNAEINQAYRRRSSRKEVTSWFIQHGFGLNQPTIPKHLFEAAVQEFGQLPSEPVKPSEKGAAKAEPRKPKQPRAAKGPVRGKIDRFSKADRALFPEIEQLMRLDSLTSTEAVRQISENKLAGRGTLESRIRRVSGRFRREKP
jgi:hypothetical protein